MDWKTLFLRCQFIKKLLELVQSLSRVWLWPWTVAHQASLSFTISWSLLKVMFIESVMPSSLSSPSPPTFNLSQHQSLLQWVSSLHQVAKVLEFQLQHQSFQWMFPLGLTGWISLLSKGLSRIFSRISLKASILQCSAFFMVQLSHPYMITGKTIALTTGSLSAKWRIDRYVLKQVKY